MSETSEPNLLLQDALNERDLVLREVLRGNPGMTEDRAEDLVDALVDSVAHTLADEQRAMAEHHGVPLDDDGPLPLRALVNAIDPRVPEAEGGPASRADAERTTA